MKRFFSIYRAQLLSALATGRNRKTAKRAKSVKPVSLKGYLLLWLLMAALATFFESTYVAAFRELGILDMFPVIFVFLTSMLTLIGSISYTKSMIFSSRDYDLLFSFPVKGSTVVAAKLAALYTLDLAISLAILLPCVVLYGVFAAPSPALYVLFAVMAILSPMLPMLAAVLVSALVSIIAARFRRAKIVGTVLYAALFVAYMVGVFGLTSGDDEQMTVMLSSLGTKFGTIYPPVMWFADALQGNILSFLLFVGVSVAAFAVVALVFGKFFGKIHEMFRTRAVRRAYKTSSSSSGVVGALVKKDITRLFSSLGAMINQMTGLLMAVVFAVAFGLQGGNLGGDEASQVQSILGMLYPFLFSLCGAMACLTHSTISLEGKTIGFLKTLPVPAKTILDAKLRVHIYLCFPPLFVMALVVGIISRLSPLNLIILLVMPLLYSYGVGVLGLILNLKRYNFNWTSEVMVVKNSLPVFITMFGGMFAVIIPMVVSLIVSLLFAATVPILAAVPNITVCVIVLAVDMLLTFLLGRNGERWFRAIEA